MSKKRRRYTEQQRALILAAARKQGLNGVQASKEFGISRLTYYTWKRKAASEARARKPGRRESDGSLVGLVCDNVRAGVRQVLPSIIREEVARALGSKR